MFSNYNNKNPRFRCVSRLFSGDSRADTTPSGRGTRIYHLADVARASRERAPPTGLTPRCEVSNSPATTGSTTAAIFKLGVPCPHMITDLNTQWKHKGTDGTGWLTLRTGARSNMRCKQQGNKHRFVQLPLLGLCIDFHSLWEKPFPQPSRDSSPENVNALNIYSPLCRWGGGEVFESTKPFRRFRSKHCCSQIPQKQKI